MAQALIYLGSKGAGEIFAREIATRIDFSVVILNQKSFSAKEIACENQKVKLLDFPNSKIKYIINFLFPNKFTSVIIDMLKILEVNHVIFCMPSPLDLKLFNRLLKNKIQITSIIHDPQKHGGEIWPPNSLIKKLYLSSTQVICLSKYTEASLTENFGYRKGVHVVPHPIMKFSAAGLEEYTFLNLPDKSFFLFIGRIRKYKGLNTLLESWKELQNSDELLVIAGQGRISRKVQKLRNVKVINRWLEEETILNLIKNSHTLIFPYHSASQSGILPIAMELNKKIVLTDVGGLKEQSQNYEKKIVIKGRNSAELVRALQEVTLIDSSDNSNERSRIARDSWIDLIEIISKKNVS